MAFGAGLAAGTVIADSTPLPTALGGTTLKIKDSTNTERLAPLFFVSSGQINYLVPAGTATGDALITIPDGILERVQTSRTKGANEHPCGAGTPSDSYSSATRAGDHIFGAPVLHSAMAGSPFFQGDRIYVRDYRFLYCFGPKP